MSSTFPRVPLAAADVEEVGDVVLLLGIGIELPVGPVIVAVPVPSLPVPVGALGGKEAEGNVFEIVGSEVPVMSSNL